MEGNFLSEYFCNKHNSYDGFIDENGKWNCWACYKEDIYYNPRGEVLMKKQIGKYFLRALSLGGHNLIIEVWKFSSKKHILAYNYSFVYLNQLILEWDKQVKSLENMEE